MGGQVDDKRIGANVQRFRNAKGMSQADLAAEVSKFGEHMHQQTVAKIEAGSRPLKYTEAVKISWALTVDVADLSAGEIEAVRGAAQLERLTEIGRMAEELRGFAERLAPLLVYLAVGVALDRTKEDVDAEVERQSADVLTNNWGRDLNNYLLDELRRQPYLAGIKPELAAPTYAEVLKRVSEPPIVWPVGDATEA